MSTIERTTPIGIYHYGVDYVHAAQSLALSERYNELSRFSSPVYFLYSHGLELLLKAHLMAKGVSVKSLKSKQYGHSLTKLYCEAIKKDLPKLDSNSEKLLNYLNEYHVSTENRYLVSGFKRLPEFGAVFSICSYVGDAARQSVHEITGLKRLPDKIQKLELETL